jgi:hypothetical protein
MYHIFGWGEVHTGFWWGDSMEGDHLKDPGVDGRIILKWISQKWDGGHGLDWSGSGQGQVAGSSECDNELSVPIKCGEFHYYLRTCWLYKKDCFVEVVKCTLPRSSQSVTGTPAVNSRVIYVSIYIDVHERSMYRIVSIIDRSKMSESVTDGWRFCLLNMTAVWRSCT